MRKKVKNGKREREKERKRERGKERENDVEYGCLTGMTGASAPFSYLVILLIKIILVQPH